jgi:hypothetical protein
MVAHRQTDMMIRAAGNARPAVLVDRPAAVDRDRKRVLGLLKNAKP